jgi:pimeloyl-ACP methyl ester carboxylesterase
VLVVTVLRPVRSNKALEAFMSDVFSDKQQPLKPEFVDYFYELSETSHNLLFISRLAGPRRMPAELDMTKQLEWMSQPTMVIWGKEDPLTPLRLVEDQFVRIPDVRSSCSMGSGTCRQ